MPKEMMPVVNKPLIEYGVEEAIQAGMNGMCIVTGRGKHSIMDHFDKTTNWNTKSAEQTKKNYWLISVKSLTLQTSLTSASVR